MATDKVSSPGLLFNSEDGPNLVRGARKMQKKKNPVYMAQIQEPFNVDTNEGRLSANEGDYIAHDPISGHVWPVAASYVEQHYEPWTDDGDVTDPINDGLGYFPSDN